MEGQIDKNMEMKEVPSPASIIHTSTVNSSAEHLLCIAGHINISSILSVPDCKIPVS